MRGFKRHVKDLPMSSSEIAIRVTNLSKRYEIYERPSDRLKQFLLPALLRLLGLAKKTYAREFWALQDLSFELKRGESLGVIGRNGSGKSTLLQLICGTLTPTTGGVELCGRVAALLELGSGFNPEFTGRENIYLNASILGLSKHEIDKKFNEIVEFADIDQFIEQPVKTYSSGMMVRLAFAVIAHVDADILIVDEALAVGDMVFTQKCMRFINEFKKTKTLLFVSHDLNAVASVSDSCLWLKNGKKMGYAETLPVIDMYSYDALKGELPSYHLHEKAEVSELKDLQSIGRAVENNQINSKSHHIGQGKAEIIAAYFSINSKGVNSFKGGELVELNYLSKFNESINGLLLGFTIKDKNGQKIVEENNLNFLNGLKTHIPSNSHVLSTFIFDMPALKGGEYSVDLAIAEGSGESYTHQNWYFDAIQITVIPDSDGSGIFRIRMQAYDFEITSFANH